MNEEIIAGTRLSNNFLTPAGEKIYQIPMGENEQEAYNNLILAFNNKQTKTYENINIDKEERMVKRKTLLRRKRN